MQWAQTSRSHHFLSDGESDVFGFITMLANIADVREQVPLSLQDHPLDLAAYSARHMNESAGGTLALADRLKIPHPMLRAGDEVEPWVMTTDFLVTLQASPGEYELLAISVKLDSELEIPRKRQLLRLEQAYWNSQNVQWLLISPSQYDKRVSMTVRMALPWGLPKREEDIIPKSHLDACAGAAASFQGKSLTDCLYLTSKELDVSMDYAQRTFWQAVWKGRLNLSLSRSGWPTDPVRLLDDDSFREQNPVAARRSICI